MPTTAKPTNEYSSPSSYLRLLWGAAALVQAGLFVIWASRGLLPSFDDPASIRIWFLFDMAILGGCLHATYFRVRTDALGLEYLSLLFLWRRWDWDQVTRLERRQIRFGGRDAVNYRVFAGRERFTVASFALDRVEELAAEIVERADLDDLGEREVAAQQGTVHVWLHPSADEEEW